MALEEVNIFQQDNIYNYIENEDESLLPFYDLHSYLTFLDNQTQNYDSTFWSSSSTTTTTTTTTLLPEVEKINPSGYSSLNRNSDVNGIGSIDEVKRRRRRSRLKKNKEEINNQRMTHIAVERNRRKQMNEYISSLRSLMPDSYVQKCDQASIVGGAINFIKELEHRLHHLNPKDKTKDLSEVFKFPQFSMSSSSEANTLADIEVSLVENHASLKIRSKRKPKLLINLITGLQNLGFIILHLNVSTVTDFILYSFSTKMEDTCKLTSVAEIATAVYEMLQCHQEDGQQ